MRFVLRTANCVIIKRENSLYGGEMLSDMWESFNKDILNMS